MTLEGDGSDAAFRREITLSSAAISAQLAQVYCAMGRREEAEDIYKQAIRIAVAEFGEEDSISEKIRNDYRALLEKHRGLNDERIASPE